MPNDQTSKGHDPVQHAYPAHRLSAKIDVTKINKDWLFQGKGTAKYLDIVMFASPDKLGSHGDAYVIYQSPSKEARQAGAKGAILGNVKCWEQQPRNGGSAARPPAKPPTPPPSSDQDVPFNGAA